MKIALAQIKPIKGQLDQNIILHQRCIEKASVQGADLIVFPELSLTAYEPRLAQELALDFQDQRLDIFQGQSDKHQITIGLGIPMKAPNGIHISQIFFKPNQPRQAYSKQYLHSDEQPYFIPGTKSLLLTIKNQKIAPAICYESLLEAHIAQANKMGATIYIASVAKPEEGISKAFQHFPLMAKKYKMPILMVNSIGYCDNFESAGHTTVWDQSGTLVEQLDHTSEGILVFDD